MHVRCVECRAELHYLVTGYEVLIAIHTLTQVDAIAGVAKLKNMG